MGPREVLNKLKWHPDLSLEKSEITIEHRGAPRDRLTFPGDKIENIGSGFMKVKREDKSVMIQYHRILKIEIPEETLWEEDS